MMRVTYLLRLMTLAFVSACSTADDLEFPAVFARSPQSSVRHWVWFQVVSIRDHGVPIVYVSTQRFKTHVHADEVMIVVSRSRFDSLAKVTRAQFARPDCATRPPAPYKSVTIEVAIHDNAPTRKCIMPSATACAFLTAVSNSPAMAWTEQELSPIASLRREVPQCQ
jgi:hypothetical protein